MAVMRLMNKLKTKLSSDENSLEDLKSVARDLESFYKTNPMSEPEGLSPKEIYKELCLIPDDPDYTHDTREVRLHELKTNLLSIIGSIIENTKSNPPLAAEPRRNVLTKARENSVELILQVFDFIKIHIIGKGEKASRKVFFLTLIVLGLCVLYWKMPIGSKQEPPAPDYKIITDTLIKDSQSKLVLYHQKIVSLNNIIQKESPVSIKCIRANSELISATRKFDTLKRVILPDLEIIKDNEIDSARRSRINTYVQILKNY